MPWFERWWFVAPSLALAVVLMLHACVSTGFYPGDDEVHIVPSLTNEWTNFKIDNISAMPLARYSYRIDYYLFRPAAQPAQLSDHVDFAGLSSWAPAVRCMSGFYHLLAAIVLWCLLRRLKVPSGAAYLVALLWATHPSACETVCWVSERKTVLTALFSFGALLAWTAGRQHFWRLPLVYVLFALANLSKASAIGFVPIFAALEFIDPQYQDARWTNLRRWRNIALSLMIPITFCAGEAALTISNHVREIVDPPGGSVFTALLTDVEIFGRYMVNTLLPYDLSFYYGVRPITSFADSRLWVFGVLELGFLIGLVLLTSREQRRLTLFGLLWFFAALGPHSNVISTPYWMQDRYMYLAMPGLLLAFVLAVRGALLKWVPQFNPQRLALSGSAYALLVIALLIHRAAVFCDADTLVMDAAMRQPLSSQARSLAANILKRNFLDHLPGGAHPDRAQAQQWGYAAAAQYAAVVNCPDVVNFNDPFEMKLRSVEILLQLGDYEAVRTALQGWLPPANRVMLNVKAADGSVITRRNELRGYMPKTLAHAWSLMAESSIAQSQAPGLPSPERRMLLDRALQEAQKALEVWDKEDEPQIVTAKVLLFSACAEAESENSASSQDKFERAMELLKSLPPDSPHASVAQYWIAHPPVPKAPAPH